MGQLLQYEINPEALDALGRVERAIGNWGEEKGIPFEKAYQEISKKLMKDWDIDLEEFRDGFLFGKEGYTEYFNASPKNYQRDLKYAERKTFSKLKKIAGEETKGKVYAAGLRHLFGDNSEEKIDEEWMEGWGNGYQTPKELSEEKNPGLMENEKLKKAFALGASILIPLGCSAPGLSGKYNLNAKAVLDDAVKFLKKAFPVDNTDFGVIGVAEASFLPDDPKVWYEVGKDGSFTFPYLDPSWWGPKDESCWQAYKDGWYDWYLEGWGKHVPKDKVLTKQEFEKVFPLYLIGSARTEFEEWPPKNANGYQPKVKLILTNPKEEKRAILKLDIAPIWKYAYGWWPKGPKNGENIDLEFADNPINAMYSAGWSDKYALLDFDGDKIPEGIAPEEGPGANWYGVMIPTFVQEDNGVYRFLHHDKWMEINVKYPALEKEEKYPELYEKLKEAGFEYLGSVYEKDLINGIVFDIQEPPPSLIVKKAEKPEPTNDIPTSVGPVPTITEGENSSVGDKVQAEPEKTEKTPGYGIGEILSAIAAAGVALGKGARRKRR